MKHLISASLAATAVVALTLSFNGCNDYPQAGKEPVRKDKDAVSTNQPQAVPGNEQRSPDSNATQTEPHAKGAARTPGTTSEVSVQKAGGERSPEGWKAGDPQRPGTGNTPATDNKVSDATNRDREPTKGGINQTQDADDERQNRLEAAKHAPDNTGRNTRDRNDDSVTATDQSESSSDIALTAEVRRTIIAHETLSMQAKNIKIVTTDGIVSLRGPVADSREVETICNIVMAVQGVHGLDNGLEVVVR